MANEDYDAPDFQNMLMAFAKPAGAPHYGGNTNNLNTRVEQARRCLFPRCTVRSCISIGRKPRAFSPQTRRALVQFVLRPMPQVHQKFTGSNPNFNPGWDGQTPNQGQWDVDNDGDGIPDSVWVDLGMPVRPTGRWPSCANRCLPSSAGSGWEVQP